jgi:hypothetical protein
MILGSTRPALVSLFKDVGGLTNFSAIQDLWWLADGAGCRRRLHVDLLHPLPLREVECTDLQQDAENRLKLVGYYGSSLRQVDWDYETHPPFAVFCSGVLASPFVPDCSGSPSYRRRGRLPARSEPDRGCRRAHQHPGRVSANKERAQQRDLMAVKAVTVTCRFRWWSAGGQSGHW